MECSQARSLIPSYLDGELSEAQAAPLRRHLLDCQPCRAGAQGEKNLKRWFAPDEPMAVSRDFAARVARRAFAGDTGDRFGPAAAAAGAGEDRSLRYVLQITSIAALVLIMLALALRSLSLPAGHSLVANTGEPSLDQAIEELDRLNRTDSRAQSPSRGAPERSGQGAERSEQESARRDGEAGRVEGRRP